MNKLIGSLSPLQELTGSLTPLQELTGILSVMSGSEPDYNSLENKPKINDVTLVGNKTFEDLGDTPLTNQEILSIFNRVFQRS